ncbi:MAG: ATP-binding protein [Planctomycetota bacterium]|nr:ATP-binding protein [Planctomycetota bacterium]
MKNRMAELEKLTGDVGSFLEEHAVPSAAALTAALALEEIITNIVKYGYDDNSEHVIAVSLELQPERLVLQVSDDGHAFDPLSAPAPDTKQPLEERRIGGLGLHLVRQMAEAVEYRRVANRNIQEVRISLASPCKAARPNEGCT